MKVNCTKAVLDLLNNQGAEGVQFIAVEHDHGCPKSSMSGGYGECTCKEVNVKVSTEDAFFKSMERSRKVRRKVEREAEKAMRKARQKGGAK
jgi:hypothetical protein